MTNAWVSAARVYFDRRILVILGLGFASGLPLALSGATLSYWLAGEGVSKAAIGAFALLALPYSLKFLWAPFLDRMRPPFGLARLGRRRGWAIAVQAALAGAILALGLTEPATAPLATALAALAVAFLSASQDIVIDAYRIEILEDAEQGAGAASIQLGYRVGMLVSGAGAIALSDGLGWAWVYAAMAACVPVGTAIVLCSREPDLPAARAVLDDGLTYLQRIRGAVVEPIADFLTRPGWLAILGLVLLYKFGDAIGGVMAQPFYVEMGFTGVEIASVTKAFGMAATILGTIAGGVLVFRLGLLPALFWGGVAQAATNLCFAWLAWHGKDVGLLAFAVGLDNFAGGVGSAAFVAYLSSLCNVAYTGAQYALLTSIMAAGRTILASGGGWLAEQVDWVTFFALTAALAIPGLMLIWAVHHLTRPARDPV